MSNGPDVQVPLRTYLEEKFEDQAKWMLATFATKDDVASLRTEIAVIKTQATAEASAEAKQGARKVAGLAGAGGTFFGALIVAVLAAIGIRLPNPQ